MNARTLSIALVAMVAFSGIAAAQEPGPEPSSGGTPSSSPSSGPRPTQCQPETPCSDPEFKECIAQGHDERACQDDYCSRVHNDWCAKYCKSFPDRPICPTATGNSGPSPTAEAQHPEGVRPCLRNADSPAAREACLKEYCQAHPEDCKRFCKDHPHAGMCAFKPAGDERHVTFEPLADGTGLANLTVNGHLVLASVRMEATGAFESKRSDHTLVVMAGDNRLELHDAASGFLRFEGVDAVVHLTFPTGVTHEDTAAGALIHYPDGGRAMLESRNLTWTADGMVSVTDFFSFHTVPGQFVGNSGGPGPADPALREKIKQGVETGKVGAEVRIHKRDCSDGRPLASRDDCSEVFAYDRVKVGLKAPKDKPTFDDPLRITLSADLEEGQTIVLHINKSVLDVQEGQVRLRYFDLPDGEASANKTEVVFLRASDLEDVLDPADDEGQPEYWVVHDANGLQVLVSVPHWSVHMVELSSLAILIPPNVSVLVGIVAGAAGIVLAAVVLFVPRRRDL